MKKKIFIILLIGSTSYLFLMLSFLLDINFLILFFIFFYVFIFLQFSSLLERISKIEKLVSDQEIHDEKKTETQHNQSADEHPIIMAAKKRLKKEL